MAWGDYDNDGDLDLALIGFRGGRIAKIYENKNSVLIKNTSQYLQGVNVGNIDWGDYDGDGDVDLALCGNNGSERITKIYKNENGILTNDAMQSINGRSQCTLAWIDIDIDGDLDLITMGNGI